MKIDGAINISFVSDGKVRIRAVDKDAAIIFMDVEISPETFTKILSSLQNVSLPMEVYNLDKVGKIQEYKQFEFPLGMDYREYFNLSHEERLKTAKFMAKEYCPKGWKPDLYFDSQSSFFLKDDKYYGRTMIRRWVDKVKPKRFKLR